MATFVVAVLGYFWGQRLAFLYTGRRFIAATRARIEAIALRLHRLPLIGFEALGRGTLTAPTGTRGPPAEPATSTSPAWSRSRRAQATRPACGIALAAGSAAGREVLVSRGEAVDPGTTVMLAVGMVRRRRRPRRGSAPTCCLRVTAANAVATRLIDRRDRRAAGRPAAAVPGASASEEAPGRGMHGSMTR